MKVAIKIRRKDGVKWLIADLVGVCSDLADADAVMVVDGVIGLDGIVDVLAGAFEDDKY